MYDFIGSRIREADLVEEGAARQPVERRERVHFREAERISPNERRHIRTAAAHECLGWEYTLVLPLRPVGLNAPFAKYNSNAGEKNKSKMTGETIQQTVVPIGVTISSRKSGTERKPQFTNSRHMRARVSTYHPNKSH